MEQYGVWEEAFLPPGKKAIGSTWVLKVKLNADGSIEKYKARLVARGFGQREGVDYFDTFAPVVRYTSLRIALVWALKNDCDLWHFDIGNAFLNGDLEEEVYMTPPPGVTLKSGNCVKLKKGLYGTKQASRAWNKKLVSVLLKFGYTQLVSESCIFVLHKAGGVHSILVVYVDDIILACPDKQTKTELLAFLSKHHVCKDKGQLEWFLGIRIHHDKRARTVWLDQSRHVLELLEKFGIEEAWGKDTPAEPRRALSQTDLEKEIHTRSFQSVIGNLTYISQISRPDILSAVTDLSRVMHNPCKAHWLQAKRILLYLKKTASYGLKLSGDAAWDPTVYVDADWATDTRDTQHPRRSISGYVSFLAGSAVSWRAAKQKTTALSTTEAEYMALALGCQEAKWLSQLLMELGVKDVTPVTMMEDNKGCRDLAANPAHHTRTKHIDIKYHFVRDLVTEGVVVIKAVS